MELHFFMQLWEEIIAFTKDLQWVVSIFHVFYFIEGVEPEFTISLQNSNLETSEANCQTVRNSQINKNATSRRVGAASTPSREFCFVC